MNVAAASAGEASTACSVNVSPWPGTATFGPLIAACGGVVTSWMLTVTVPVSDWVSGELAASAETIRSAST